MRRRQERRPKQHLKRLLEAKPAELSKWLSSRSSHRPHSRLAERRRNAALHADLAPSG